MLRFWTVTDDVKGFHGHTYINTAAFYIIDWEVMQKRKQEKNVEKYIPLDTRRKLIFVN